MKKYVLSSTIILFIAFGYAIIRYNVIKGVSWIDLPLFISNKAIALAAVIFIAISYALGSLARFWPKIFVPALGTRKFFGLAGFCLSAFHGILSLLIFSPTYYSKFFLGNGRLNLTGGLSTLFGVLSFFLFTCVAISSIPGVIQPTEQEKWFAIQRLGYLGLVAVLAHVFVMGFEGWLKPSGWPGGLLPISLVAASIILVVLLLKMAAILSPKQKI
ncbi:MAG: hypothetical protein HYT15_01905 [Candidatus Magasanikbacteria bacterium]|nr:hypothetical protein [Candidatus Magasanikbacteria bacterium]